MKNETSSFNLNMVLSKWVPRILGSIMVIAGLYFTFNSWQFRRTAIRTLGTIEAVDFEHTKCKSAKSSYECTKFFGTIDAVVPQSQPIRFKAMLGKKRGHVTEFEFTGIYQGKIVPVTYDPKDTTNIMIDTRENVWGKSVLFLALGTFLLLLSSSIFHSLFDRTFLAISRLFSRKK
jgi:hypothetical protein